MLRALCLLFLFFAAASGGVRAEISFSDVLPSDPYAESVQQLARAGVLFGYPDGTFRGEEPVTRAELAVVVARMMRYFESVLPAGTAREELSQGAISEMQALTPTAASAYLESRNVKGWALKPDNLSHPATMDDVTSAVSQAMARMVERVAPGFEGEQDELGHEGYSHDDE